MRIAYLIHSLFNAGGTEKVLTLKANYLADVCGEDVSILTAKQSDKPVFFPLSPRIRTVDLGIDIEGRRNLLAYKKVLSEWLTGNPQDIVISLSGNEILILPFLNDGSRKIAELHFAYKDLFAWYGDRLDKQIIRYFRKKEMLWSASRLDAFVVLTKAERTNLQGSLKNIHQIYNPLSFNNPLKADLTSKRFIAVGRLSKEKNYDDSISAWTWIRDRHPDWQLHIYGDGPRRKHLLRMIEKEGLSKHVFLRGRSANIEKEMIDSSGIILSSDTEAFPMVLLEAAACGLPIVTYDCSPGIREIVEDGGNGFIVPAGNNKELAVKAIGIIEDETMRKRMGARSAAISEPFNLDAVMEQWVALFHQLIGRNKNDR